MPQSQPHQRQSSQKSPRKRQLWANRYRRLKEWVNSLPPLLILRAEKLIQVFLKRKSLHLRLADNYLIELWGHVSRATVQRTLQQLEKLGLLKRITGPPKRQADGSCNFVQTGIIDSIIEDCGLTKARKFNQVPAKSSAILTAHLDSPPFSGPLNYQSVIGKLNYLA